MIRRSGFGWLEFILGLLLVALGIFTFTRPLEALMAVVIIYGVTAILMGIGDIVMYIRAERFTGFAPMLSLISGILSVMSGVMLIAYPGAGTLVLGILFPIWFITHCVSRLARLDVIRVFVGNGIYYCLLILNIIGLILGVLLLLAPYWAIISASWIIGFYLVLLGAESIVLAFSKVGSRF